ncbi:MAG: bifunctional 23S rRNA (guanine(2069)-N(7))-methyltransferase RlmK/23S rRNA (guanine(2445)-N(2))-methyltransferase RlmL [Methylococcales bacterium]|jgi:23S rRNA (guanine2445-N2)-methyltransferase / 23S rRNA (guanine2069-N7)-methyltransferase|nr:bifunctional 23S rRNA (guanine(2069)-N(7))-methyltransferase RlmK/23S rRNA (guanine(2445)-N(2))-methyltransferase RlmL [Methylococcales bacterium]MBT7446039.1 bifunctional 23S rRNA (guanine(2069)-N(7))-methyltransferase RlmK/23S rRNA (guanine(2445)-N(2))-methyltransferase RlmL [Methylococcales bacterium]
MFANRLKKNIKHLAKWARKSDIECYRIYDVDIPEYAVAIDLYGDRVCVQEYAPPKSIDEEKATARLIEVVQTVAEILSIDPDLIYLKVRQQQKGLTQYEKLDKQDDFFTVREHNCLFRVNLANYLDTGLFLDHRPARKMVQEMARNKRVLNLFAYTGSVSVYAAKGGAKQVTTVDLSNTYIDWAEKNFELNHLKGEQYEFIRADCLLWLKQQTCLYDLIFLDPPSFSNSKKMSTSFDVLRDQCDLINNTMKLLSSEGTLIFSNNKRKFVLDDSLSEKYVVKNISKSTIPKDFERRSDIHQCWLIHHPKLEG